jgi:omega-amidase
MKISFIQTALHWEQAEANRAMLAAKIKPLAHNSDIIILPEMFSTGFSMNAETLAEAHDGATFQWMKEQSKLTNAAVVGSFMCSENGQFYNRLIWMQPDGLFFKYDKKHLFALAGEDKVFTAGQEHVLIEWKGWRIRPLICYDLRFPEWARQPLDPTKQYDLLIYVANWPQPRIHHWKSLLMARAIENQCYTVGVNIAGIDGKGLIYSGDSAIIDCAGQVLSCAAYSEQVVTAELDLEQQQKYRAQFPFLKDANSI